MKYTVGLNMDGRAKVLTVDGEDALMAALKEKHENPAAMITYVRKSNRRGDQRHPHQALATKRRGSK